MTRSSWIGSVIIGVAIASAVSTETWVPLLLGVVGVVFMVLTLAHPRLGLLLWLLLAPAANTYATIALPAGFPDITFSRVTIGLVVVAVLLRTMLQGQRFARVDGMALAMAAMLFIMLVDLLLRSRDLMSDALQEFDLYVMPMLIFLAARNLLGTGRDHKRVAWILAVVGVYLALHGTYQYIALSSPGTTDAPLELTVVEGGQRVQESHLEGGRAVGPFESAVEYGSVVAITFVAALYLTLHQTRRFATLVPLAMLVPIGLGVAFSSTRSVWLGAYLAVLAMAVFSRARRWLTLSVLGTATAVIVTAAVILPEASLLRERTSSVEPVYARLLMYRIAARVALREPFFGYGRGAPARVAAREEANAIGGTDTDLAPGQYHNVFIGLLIDWGLVGLAAYLAVLVLAIRGVVQLRRSLAAERGPAYHFCSAFLAIAVIYVVQGWFVDLPPFLYLNGAFFLLAGMLHGHLASLASPSPTPAAVAHQLPPLPAVH